MTEEKHEMLHHAVGMLLVYLHMTASEEGIQILQSPAELWLTSGKPAKLDCKTSEEEVSTMWYKEQQNGGLQWIHQSSKFDTSEGKYSSQVNTTAKMYSLIISNVQRNDSGVYYCGLFSFLYLQPNFGNGTRLVVTDASEPRLSILVPSDPGDAELPHNVPLLCLLSDFTPLWSVLWDTGEGASEGQTDAGVIDGDGIFSVWSLTTIPSEWWNQGTSCTCTTKERGTGRHISATVAMETERKDAAGCEIVLYAGLPCIFILLLTQLLILLRRKRPTGGRAVERGKPVRERQIPQTEYATLPYRDQNAPL